MTPPAMKRAKPTTRPRELLAVFACMACGRHWWTREAAENPGHECPEGYPSGGTALGLYEEVGHPQSDGE